MSLNTRSKRRVDSARFRTWVHNEERMEAGHDHNHDAKGLFPDYDKTAAYKRAVHLDMEAFRHLSQGFSALPDKVQVLGNPWIKQELDIAYDPRTYKPMALMLMASFLDLKAKETSGWLDYKCYSSEQTHETEILPLPSVMPTKAVQNEQGSEDSSMSNPYVPTPIHGRSLIGMDGELKNNIQVWCRLCMQQYYHSQHRPEHYHHHHHDQRIFRRTLCISFVTAFIEHETDGAVGGHAITLGIEAGGGNRWFKLFIFDYRAHEYLYAVHDQLFNCMQEAVLHDEYRLLCKVHTSDIQWETVALCGRLHYGDKFMMCMSLSFRVCMYLSYVKNCFDMLESRAAFKRDAKVFTHTVYTMINSLVTDKRVANGSLVVLQSPQMSYPLLEVNPKHCYLMLVNQADADMVMECPRIEMWGLLEKAVSTMRFTGFKKAETGELANQRRVFEEIPNTHHRHQHRKRA